MDAIQRNGKTYLSLDDLAARTGYDREYLRKLAKSGKVDAFQVGATTLMNPDDLERYRHGRSSRGPHGEKPKRGGKSEIVYEKVSEES